MFVFRMRNTSNPTTIAITPGVRPANALRIVAPSRVRRARSTPVGMLAEVVACNRRLFRCPSLQGQASVERFYPFGNRRGHECTNDTDQTPRLQREWRGRTFAYGASRTARHLMPNRVKFMPQIPHLVPHAVASSGTTLDDATLDLRPRTEASGHMSSFDTRRFWSWQCATQLLFHSRRSYWPSQ